MLMWDLVKQGVGLAFLILAGCTFVIEFCYTRFILRRLRSTRTLSTTDARAVQYNERRRQENTERIQEETSQRAQARKRIQEEQRLERNQWVAESNNSGGYSLRSSIAQDADEETLSSTQLMELQDYEFEKALEIDRQKEREVQGKQAKLEQHKAFRQKLESLVPPEPPANTEEKCCKIAIRLSSGSRVQRSFLMTDKLKDVFNFVHTKEVFNVTKFSLINNFPKRTFVLGDDDNDHTEDNTNTYIVTEETLAELKFSPSEAFFVEPLQYLPG